MLQQFITRARSASYVGIETALNAYLRLDPETARHLETLSGKTIAVRFRDLGLEFHLHPVGRILRVTPPGTALPDTWITGTVASFAQLSARLTAGRTDVYAGVEIEGDAETGRVLRDTLARVAIDWEEIVAQRIGDLAAHQLGNLARMLGGIAASAQTSFEADLAAWLQEEARLTPSRAEIEDFMDEVDRLRMDTDRLAARVQRLREAF